MNDAPTFTSKTLQRDLVSGVVVFLVALPLCLGIALASGAPPISGIVAGIIGGIVIGSISKSSTSVSGPAAGLTAVVFAQIAELGSFSVFLYAVILAGFLQIGFGIMKAGFLASFFPSNVIKGLLAAIGIILILKQIPHLLGKDTDPEGDMAFFQKDHENTLTEIGHLLNSFHTSAAIIGIVSLVFLIVWDQIKPLKKSLIPSALVVVILGVIGVKIFDYLAGTWVVGRDHLVQIPITPQLSDFWASLSKPDFSKWNELKVYTAALTIAIVASLETLLNLEAVDKLDPKQRTSPPNRELFAQGIGNIACGFTGGLPVTSVVIRGSVNVNSGCETKFSAIFHGVLLLVSVLFLPQYINQIPISCLAAILLMSGFKLASPKLFKQLWKEGFSQFLPFAVTVIAIMFTDLLEGILIGMGISFAFILYGNSKRTLRLIMEKHLGGDVLRIELASHVSFLSRATLLKRLQEVPKGGHVLLDARETGYIDPDILDMIDDFVKQTAPARGVQVSMAGFQDKYKQITDNIQYVDFSTRELQESLTPNNVIDILKEGNLRFHTNTRLTRDLGRGVIGTAQGQFPLAVVLSCIDSRTPAELIFDLGVGDIFSVRLAGHVVNEDVLGSMEYACAVAGSKLIAVIGHTKCGAVTAAVNFYHQGKTALEVTGCQHIDHLVQGIQTVLEPSPQFTNFDEQQKNLYIDNVVYKNVRNTMNLISQRSPILNQLIREGKIQIVGGVYNVATGLVEFLDGVKPANPTNLLTDPKGLLVNLT